MAGEAHSAVEQVKQIIAECDLALSDLKEQLARRDAADRVPRLRRAFGAAGDEEANGENRGLVVSQEEVAAAEESAQLLEEAARSGKLAWEDVPLSLREKLSRERGPQLRKAFGADGEGSTK